jgi:hypothetical protein
LSQPKKVADLVDFDAMLAWTPEQWAEYERKLPEPKRQEPWIPSAGQAHLGKSRRALMLERGWPLRAVEAAEQADPTKPAIAKLAEWDHAVRNIAVLSGPAGTGKTVGAAHWCLKQRERVRFGRASTFAASGRYNAEQRAFWYESDGLCLDDLGAEYLDAKGSFLVDLDELIDTYYADRRPLLITTNLAMTDFKARYGRRVEDRIRECAMWFVVGGDSLRRAP